MASGGRRKSVAIGKKKAGDFRSTLATGSAVSGDTTFGLKKKREEEARGVGIVRVSDDRAEEIRAEVEAARPTFRKEAGAAGRRRIEEGGVGSASARFKYGDLEGRKQRTKKVRYRQI